MNWTLWGPAVANGVCALLATVLAALVLHALRRARLAAVGAQDASKDAAKHAKAAAGNQVSALDVASLQGWARSVDVTLADMREGKSTDLAHRLETDGRLRRIESVLAEFEGFMHGKAVGTDQISG